jgi:hypothetical protein
MEHRFLEGVQTNIRCQVFGGVLSNLRALFQPGYTTTRRLGELYESVLYSKVEDGAGKAPRCLADLRVTPPGEGTEFKPKYDNWRLRAKVPVLVLNATTLNTGHNWQFTASWMGEPPSSVDSEIEGNYQLRRMYHWEAPRLRDKWHAWHLRPFAPLDYRKLRLGHAVAASSSVPGLFEPLTMADLYDGKTVRLVDGGVYDNQGIASLLEQDCNVMIVSDASGQMKAQDQPSGGRVGVPLRSASISQSRVRQAQYRELDARRRSGLLKGLMFLHLKKDLESEPVSWRECQDPLDTRDRARSARRNVLVGSGLQKEVQELLSGIRTDLDSFTDVEAFSLMTSGYRQAQAQLRACLPAFAGSTSAPVSWRFLVIEPALQPGRGFDPLKDQLRIGEKIAGKVWFLSKPLAAAAIIVIAAALAGLVWLWLVFADRQLLTVRTLGVTVAVGVATLVVPRLVQLARYRQTVRDVGIRTLLGALVAVGFKIHRRFFDPIFLAQGKAERLLALRRGGDAGGA